VGEPRAVSGDMPERHRPAMRAAMRRGAKGNLGTFQGRDTRVTGTSFVDPRSSETVQAVDGVAYIMNRHEGGDARFGGLARDIEQKAARLARPGVYADEQTFLGKR